MTKAKEMANSFRLSEDLVDKFDIPPKTDKWGRARKELNEAEKDSGYVETDNSEYVEGKRKVKIIDWKKTPVRDNFEKNKSSVFNLKGDPRAMKSE